ncbi:hypothetical protein IT072_18430 [Leifsonia sp. ZF2019]|uniref:sporulation-delaying protein SdpB family protein n=1 Tax=Leifsonia sp. ZF2019 TaxID=2781978 RepID=UPI001CC1A799|nr:sporulation-delaying protein SdpB family protein [Leifsonia sp. ZF2019]UAJ79157.1 hypothetical protein IT072_18430 [Leifsonia sp. ZF2019]
MFSQLSPGRDLLRAFDSLANNIPRFRSGSIQVQVGRSLIALAQLITLALTPWVSLSADVVGRTPVGYCEGVRQISVFCLGSEVPNEFGRWAGTAIAILVISGLFPRYTSVLHAWLALSMGVSLSVPDGGESVAVFSAVLLIAVTVPDGRVNGWARRGSRTPSGHLQAIGYAGSIALCLQLSGIYFESGLAKLAVTDWVNGSAMFYITRDPMFGSVGVVGDVLHWFTALPIGTALLTWGTIIAEVSFAVLFLCPAPLKKYGLIGAITLHLGIGVIMGLWSFALTMIGTAVVAAHTLRPRESRANDEAATENASNIAPAGTKEFVTS